jgi:hypothetical protein
MAILRRWVNQDNREMIEMVRQVAAKIDIMSNLFASEH